MKKFAKIFALVLVLAMTLCVMAACGEKPSTSRQHLPPITF